MCVSADEVKNTVNLALDDARVEKYLHGETLDCDTANGWCLVCVEGYPLGFGKAVNGVVKNHLPKGLRKL
jgi:NOL1/NOP2/fmu family ribosome biogenesis protein